jgi:hypothetical protein
MEDSIDMLSKADQRGDLPLHRLLCNVYTTTEAALLMIDKYPAALRHQNYVGFLPLHIECGRQCRSIVISKCIELYPQSLEVGNMNGYTPLLLLIYTNKPLTQTLELIHKCTAAVRLPTSRDYLPLHFECDKLCRPTIISKLIELYPEALSMCNKSGNIPWTLALQKTDCIPYIYQRRKSLTILLSAYPSAFYHPPHDPIVNKLAMMRHRTCRRMILNLFPSCLSSAAHLQSYHDLNWQSSCSLLHLWLQIRMKHRRSHFAFLERSSKQKIKDRSARQLMMKILEQSSLMVIDTDSQGYGIDLGDGIGDLMLRFIIAYL